MYGLPVHNTAAPATIFSFVNFDRKRNARKISQTGFWLNKMPDLSIIIAIMVSYVNEISPQAGIIVEDPVMRFQSFTLIFAGKSHFHKRAYGTGFHTSGIGSPRREPSMSPKTSFRRHGYTGRMLFGAPPFLAIRMIDKAEGKSLYYKHLETMRS
jgi:hypothetical protein